MHRLAVPVPGECVAALAIDNTRKRLYGLSMPGGIFFVYDISGDSVNLYDPVSSDGKFSKHLVLDAEGNVYGTTSCGRLFRYDPVADKVTNMSLVLPGLPSRSYYNQMESAVLDEFTGLIYGGGTADGVLFVFNPREGWIRSLGKAAPQPGCRAITVTLDGRVYGIAGERDSINYLFCYDPEKHELRNLGVLFAVVDRPWHGYEFDAACTGQWGEIYFGESDRISHLFIDHPPLLTRKGAENK